MSLVFSDETLDTYGPASSEVFFAPDKKAYTEDNILIYNIFVYNIPRWVNDADITRYFSKFGVISQVRLVCDKRRSRRSAPIVGRVNFVEPESAYRVLQEFNHRIRGFRVAVKADNSWNQPDAEKAYSQVVRGTQQKKAEASNVDTNFTGLTVLSLNDDCLEIICGLLWLRDQIRFAMRAFITNVEIYKENTRKKMKEKN